MKTFLNIILSLLTIVIAILATVFVAEKGVVNTFDGFMSLLAGVLLVMGLVVMLDIHNPFAELWKAFHMHVFYTTLWGNQSDVPPVVYGNVDLEDKQMKKIEEMETQITALQDQIKSLEANVAFYKSTAANWQNTSRRKDAEIKELKNQLHSCGMDHAKAEMRVNELVRELNAEKRGAETMITSLTAQVKELAEGNIRLMHEANLRLMAERKASPFPPKIMGVWNDNINYNDDWQLIHAAEKLIESANGKAGNSDQVEDIRDLEAKVAVARNYAAGNMDDKYIPSDLKTSIRGIMTTISNWLI